MAITDHDFKMRWVAALRSGEYKQGYHRLWDGAHEYCCLGVACQVLGEPLIKDSSSYFMNYLPSTDSPLRFDDHGTLLINGASLGITNKEIKKLSNMNDAPDLLRPQWGQRDTVGGYDHAFPFEVIADWIELNL